MADPFDSVPQVPGFEILELLGRGGCGTVWSATQTRLSRKVALKLLATDALPSKQMRRRFIREAQALASVRHPGIVEVLAFQGDGPMPYLAMEMLAGGTLRQRLDRAPRGLGDEASLRLARELLEALDALHEAGMVHRDVKPSNVLFREDGQAVLGDLGVVHVNLEGATRMTGTHELLGTLPYFAPELYRRRDPTVRSDLFALGVTLYEAITGQHPTEFRPFPKDFSGADPRAVLPACPPALAALVKALMAPDPKDRPESAMAALERLDSSRPVPSHHPRRVRRGSPAFAGAGVALALGLGLGLTAGVWLGMKQAGRRDGGTPVAARSPSPAVAPGTPFGPVQLLGLARWPEPELALLSSAAIRAGWVDASGAALPGARDIAPGRESLGVPAALVQAGRGVLRVAPANGRPFELDVDLAPLAPAPPDPHTGLAFPVGAVEPEVRSPGGVLHLSDLVRLTGVGCVVCIAPRPTPALESALLRIAKLPGVRPLVQIPVTEEAGQPVLPKPPAGTPWGPLLKKIAAVTPTQVMVMPALYNQDPFQVDPKLRQGLPTELDLAWRRDLRELSPDLTLLPPPIALTLAAVGVDIATPADRPMSVIAPLLHDNSAHWDSMVATLGRITSRSDAPQRTAFVWLSQRESMKDSWNVIVQDKRENRVSTLEELSLARALVLARRAFPRSTLIADLAYEAGGDAISRYFMVVQRTIGALRGVTCTGSLPTTPVRAPHVTPAKQLVALAFSGSGRNVQVIFSDRGRCTTRFTPAAPGMLCVNSTDVGPQNIQRVCLDTTPIDIDMEGGLALYEELAPAMATRLER